MEDGPDNREIITHLIERAGADVAVAENGQIAVDIVLSAEGPFDVILMDMQMPVLDGYAATVRLRSEGYRAPIIALTANAMDADRQRSLDAGCDDFEPKPIRRRELIESIRRIVQTERA